MIRRIRSAVGSENGSCRAQRRGDVAVWTNEWQRPCPFVDLACDCRTADCVGGSSELSLPRPIGFQGGANLRAPVWSLSAFLSRTNSPARRRNINARPTLGWDENCPGLDAARPGPAV